MLCTNRGSEVMSRDPPPPATPALVAHAQGGLTLGPERGELAADFWSLGELDCEISRNEGDAFDPE
jgi:hypothetical protein